MVFDVKKINVKELTVRQVREVLDGLETVDSLHTLEFLFPGEIPARAVSLSTGLSLEELDGDIPVSEMEQLIQAVKAKNAFFLAMMKRLEDVGKSALQTQTG